MVTLATAGAAFAPGGVADALAGLGGGGGMLPAAASTFCRLESVGMLLISTWLLDCLSPARGERWKLAGCKLASSSFLTLPLVRLVPTTSFRTPGP